MTERQIQAELEALGLDEESHRVVALLPLVLVAWADQAIQEGERKTILEVARGHDMLEGRGGEVLEGWLTKRPSNEVFRRGTLLFVHLAHRREGLGADMPESSVDFVVELCSVVAESAGGVFGLFNRTSAEERKAIRVLTEAIDAEAKRLAGPLRGVVGRSMTDSWIDVMVELQTEEAPKEG